MKQSKPKFFPYIYHTVKTLPILSEQERITCLELAGNNLNNLRPHEITFDLLTDSGNSSRSIEQFSSIYVADEGPFRISETAKKLERLLIEVFGFPFVDLYPQGRSAEQAFSSLMVKPGQVIPGNMTYTTTQHHQQTNGGKPVSVVCEEAFHLDSAVVFKGNVDLSKLSALIAEEGDNIAYVNIELCSNSIGGYPISMKNLEKVNKLTSSHNILLILDSTRILENAKFIQEFEDGFKNDSISSIVKQICNLSDGCVKSLKKDFLTSNGGYIGVRDAGLYSRLRDYSLVSGTDISATDLATIYQGIKEAVYLEEHMDSRFSLTKRLFDQLKENGVPLVEPSSCHGVWIRVQPFVQHLSEMKSPQVSLQNALYLKGGIRSGSATLRKPDGELIPILRLALPHRLYNESQVNYIAYAVTAVWNEREKLIDYEVVEGSKGLLEQMVAHYRSFPTEKIR
ncbi:tryptophanase [Brevibacterium sp. JNUCC-42]|nr:tryptophanase [Brevibacterium sp. JNUCC-42]